MSVTDVEFALDATANYRLAFMDEWDHFGTKSSQIPHRPNVTTVPTSDQHSLSDDVDPRGDSDHLCPDT